MAMVTCTTEFHEQCTVVDYLELLKKIGKIKLFTALPNNTWTKSWSQKHKQKAEGQRKGFPDLCVITNKRVIFIEMKRLKNSSVSPEQKEWIEGFNSMSIPAKICKGCDEAIEFIKKNL